MHAWSFGHGAGQTHPRGSSLRAPQSGHSPALVTFPSSLFSRLNSDLASASPEEGRQPVITHMVHRISGLASTWIDFLPVDVGLCVTLLLRPYSRITVFKTVHISLSYFMLAPANMLYILLFNLTLPVFLMEEKLPGAMGCVFCSVASPTVYNSSRLITNTREVINSCSLGAGDVAQ